MERLQVCENVRPLEISESGLDRGEALRRRLGSGTAARVQDLAAGGCGGGTRRSPGGFWVITSGSSWKTRP